MAGHTVSLHPPALIYRAWRTGCGCARANFAHQGGRRGRSDQALSIPTPPTYGAWAFKRTRVGSSARGSQRPEASPTIQASVRPPLRRCLCTSTAGPRGQWHPMPADRPKQLVHLPSNAAPPRPPQSTYVVQPGGGDSLPEVCKWRGTRAGDAWVPARRPHPGPATIMPGGRHRWGMPSMRCIAIIVGCFSMHTAGPNTPPKPQTSVSLIASSEGLHRWGW